jgi:hypothetical protein
MFLRLPQVALMLGTAWAICAAIAADGDDATLAGLFEAHRWFELRDAASAAPTPAIYRGAVAAAFNDRARAEKELRSAKPYQAWTAHDLLLSLYLRNGDYPRAAAEARLKWAARPEKTAPAQEQALVALFQKWPSMAVMTRGPATVTYTTEGGDAFAPLVVNGEAAKFTLDTGGNMSAISEAEAKRLHLTIRAEEIALGGVTGSHGGGARSAVAERLTIGKTEFRNVAFLVMGDDQEPFKDYPLGERGILGLPVLLGVQTFRWNRQRQLEMGFTPGRVDQRSANLCFDGVDPLAQVVVQAHRLTVMLDTGGEDSELWPAFADALPASMSQGRKGSRDLTGLTGSASLEATVLPEVRVKLGGFEMLFRDAPVLARATVGASKWHHGRIGMDLLNQANRVTIDFRAMKITLE